MKYGLLIACIDAYVPGSTTQLVQVNSNILNNGAKYTPQGGEISLVLKVDEQEARDSVSDNGSGIDPSLLPHVFELITQTERTPGGLTLRLGWSKAFRQHIISKSRPVARASDRQTPSRSRHHFKKSGNPAVPGSR